MMILITPVLGQLVYRDVRADLNYPFECAICTDPMTRQIAKEFIASFELCTAIPMSVSSPLILWPCY